MMQITTTPAAGQELYDTPLTRIERDVSHILSFYSDEATFNIIRPIPWREISQNFDGHLVKFDDGDWMKSYEIYFDNERVTGRISVKIDPYPLLNPPTGTAR